MSKELVLIVCDHANSDQAPEDGASDECVFPVPHRERGKGTALFPPAADSNSAIGVESCPVSVRPSGGLSAKGNTPRRICLIMIS